jgi:hypothetical protein
VTVLDKSARKDGTFSRDDFVYDHERNVYVCPGGKELTTTGTRVNDDATVLYRASKHDCAGCALKSSGGAHDTACAVGRFLSQDSAESAGTRVLLPTLTTCNRLALISP